MPTKIEWAQETWNPIIGCSHCSPGCDHCYAERMACRLYAMGRPEYAGMTACGKMDREGALPLRATGRAAAVEAPTDDFPGING